MSRKFGMITGAIWSSNKFSRLETDTARLGYIYLHTCQHGNSNGCFRLPAAYMDADIKTDAAAAILQDIHDAGLIEYDHDESVVRIVSFFSQNKITNSKHLQGSIQAFDGIPSRSTVLANLALDIIAVAYNQAQALISKGQSQLKTGTSAKAREYGDKNLNSAAEIMGILQEFTAAQQRDRPDQFQAATVALRIPLSEALCLDLGIQRERDKDTETDTETRTDTDTKTDTDTRTDIKGVTNNSSASAQPPPPPSPRKSGSGAALQKGKGAALAHEKKAVTFEEIKKENGI